MTISLRLIEEMPLTQDQRCALERLDHRFIAEDADRLPPADFLDGGEEWDFWLWIDDTDGSEIGYAAIFTDQNPHLSEPELMRVWLDPAHRGGRLRSAYRIWREHYGTAPIPFQPNDRIEGFMNRYYSELWPDAP